ncbi:leucoanthocyanidin reductase-like [Malania oleifera]|uniref:leucoanthocyanidin reductase-like n=1 Tax=Malania oleifera TaxID=397392 RepID=UPI0025AE57FC|nr:leucoanthocyanidin reductase-like [Malania oleifera]
MTVLSSSPCSNGSSAAGKGRVLIAGATGFIGQFVAEASLNAAQPTFLILRPPSAVDRHTSKSNTIKALQHKGAIIIHGSIKDQEFMEKVLKENEIDTVIAAVGGENILDQLPLVHAIRAVGTIKRFVPSEFGHDVDRADPVEPGLTMYKEKRRVRRCIEECGVPYTYVCCNSIASWPYFDNTHPSHLLPPLDCFQIYGDGCIKAYFVAGTDIGKFTMKVVDDVRTRNKIVHFRPSSNFLNMNELASLWEKKIRRTLPRVTIEEDDLLAIAKENRIPESIVASFTHEIFIRGCQINFTIDGESEVEVTSLYPDDPFRTMDECFDDFAFKIPDSAAAANPAPPLSPPPPAAFRNAPLHGQVCSNLR